MSLKLIKNKIRATDRTRKVTKAMEAVSAVKMRKSQERALHNRSYAEAALRILANVQGTPDIAKSPYMVSTGHRECIVVMTSDKGLAGSLNSAVLKQVESYTKGKDPQSIVAVCLGRKGYEFCLRKGFDIVHYTTQISDEINTEDLREIADHALRAYQTSDVARLSVFFQNFVSTFAQEPVRRELLPLNQETITDMIKGIIPKTGRYSEEEIRQNGTTYTLEPNSETIFDTLVPELTHILLYHALLETKASEHSARMVAMKNASDNAKQVSKTLTLQYNKARQAAITREVSEIVGGMEAMSTNG